jgi:Putative Flp pilus-assembly TadE/G-like
MPAKWHGRARIRRAAHPPGARNAAAWGRVAARVGDERGAVLVIMALLLVALIGLVGFAVDLGWFYWNRIEVQHGADAAALGGVIYVTTDAAKAKVEGRAAAAENGYVDASLGGTDVVLIIDSSDDPASVGNASQLRATISHVVPTFFIKIFGINTMTIVRTAVAEYVLPLPLGSPESYFGNDPALGRWPNFWGNIHGYYTGKGMGDRYSSQCYAWESLSDCEKNDERRLSLNAGTQEATGGYLYGVEVADASVGSMLTVELFDPQFTRGGGDDYLTGDQEQGSSPGPITTFMLYDPDPTPLDTVGGDNTLRCSVSYAPRDAYADFNGDGLSDEADDQDGDGDLDFDDVDLAYPGGVDALWEPFCTIPITESGIFPLRVMVDDPGSLDQQGLNRWSLRAFTSSGPSPRVYGLGDMAIYANVDGKKGDTEFYLTEVSEAHAGKRLVIELFDPGDAKGKHSVEIIDPNGDNPPCEWKANESAGKGKDEGSEKNCDIPTSKSGGGGKFNNWTLTIWIDLPGDYACGADCWWKVRYNYPDETSDTTTWSAWIEGNPLRLVE